VVQGRHDANADGRPDAVGLSVDAREAGDIDIVLDEKVQPPNAPDPGRPAPEPQPRPQPPRTPACAIDDGAISGTITNDSGDAVEGAQVLAVPAGPTTAAGVMPAPALPVRSDADGNYKVAGLCEGAYHVLAFLPGASGMQMGFYDADADGAPDRVSLRPDARLAETVDVQLVSLLGPGFPDNGRTLPLPRPVPLPLPPTSGW
jgi:hypothetical protein